MGLIEKLIDKTVELVAAEGRSQREARRELRNDLVTELRAYAAEIETLRIELHTVRRQIVAGRTASRVEPPAVNWPRELDIARQLEAAGLDTELHREVSNALEVRMYHILAGERDPLADGDVDLSDASKDLKLRWATLKSMLEDCVELEAVKALRVARHQVHDAEGIVYEVLSRGASQDDDRLLVIKAIDSLLLILDRWNNHIFGIRQRVLDD